jgi:uncharacterized protein YjdB
MKATIKALNIMLAMFLFGLAGCLDILNDSGETAENQAENFKSVYQDIFNIDIDTITNDALLNQEDRINTALDSFRLLRPEAKGLLSAEKAKLDILAEKLKALKEAAAVFYIAPDGNDTTGDGSKENPWFSINKAEEAVSAGCTVYIRGGTYQITDAVIEDNSVSLGGGVSAVHVFKMTKSGKNASPINYFAYPGDPRPVFDMSAVAPLDKRVYVLVVEGSYLHFKGFDIVGTQVNVSDRSVKTQSECILNMGGNSNTYEELAMHDGMAIGFYITEGSNNLILNCDAYNNYDSQSDNGSGGDTDGFGVHLSSTGYNNNVFRGCRTWNNSDDGFDAISCSSAITVENCWSFYNGRKLVNGSYAAANGSGVGFKIGGFGNDDATNPVSPTPRHTIKFSLAAFNRGQGFYANHHWGGNDWYNNTAYKNRNNFNMWGRKDGAGGPGYNHVLVNNLSYGPTESGSDITNAPVEENTRLNNSFDLGITITDSDFVSVSDWTELRSPRKADGNLPDINFLKPAPRGQLIDRGKNIDLSYAGNAPELGCMENSGGTVWIPVTAISLDQETLEIAGTAGKTLTAVITPAGATNKAVTWQSSAPGVARVAGAGQSAVVTGVAKGTAAITVTTEDGAFSAVCEVTVIKAAVTSVTLDKETMTLPAGGNGTLTASIKPEEADNKEVTWQSSDTSVAAITGSGSTVTINAGGSAGSANITATTADGGFTDTCTVTVEAPVAVTGVTLDKETLTLLVSKTGTLTAAIAPGDAANKGVTWASSNTGVATVTGTGLTAMVTAVGTGTATITVTTADSNKTDTCTVTVVAAPSLIVKNQSSSPGTSTADNDSFIVLTGSGNSWTWTGTQTVENAVSNSRFNTGGVRGTTLVYLDIPVTGPYTFTANISITGADTTGNTGFAFGELADPSSAVSNDTFKNLVGIRSLSTGAHVGYYMRSSDSNLATGAFSPSNPSLSKGGEYIYEVMWDGSKYSVKVTNSGTEYTKDIKLSDLAAVFKDRGVAYHPGLFLVKQTISISEITLTFD